MRYWVYIHDDDGELVDDLGEFPSIADAESAIAYLFTSETAFKPLKHTIRLVDNHQESTTVWLAGSMKYIRSIAGTLVNG